MRFLPIFLSFLLPCLSSANWNNPPFCQSSAKAIAITREKLGAIRNQSQRENCFAHPLADLATLACGQRISAADITVQTLKKEMLMSKNWGAFSEDVLESMRPLGFCPEEKFPEENFHRLSTEDFQRNIERLQKSAGKSDCANSGNLHLLKDLFNSDPQSLAQILKTTNSQSFLAELANKSCQPRLKTCAAIETEGLISFDFDEATDKMKAAYEKAIVKVKEGKPTVFGLELKPFLAPAYESYTTAHHMMTAIGLEHDGKKCRIRFRNSWGARGCQDFNNKVQCDSQHPGEILIAVDEIQKVTFEVTGLQ